jgi:hypothetical protein
VRIGARRGAPRLNRHSHGREKVGIYTAPTAEECRRAYMVGVGGFLLSTRVNGFPADSGKKISGKEMEGFPATSPHGARPGPSSDTPVGS